MVMVQIFEKFNFKYRKALLDLEFLQSYKKEKLIPKFLQFRVDKKRLESSETYPSCQRPVLNQEMSVQYKSTRTLNNNIKSIKSNLYNKMSFVHVTTKFVVSNDKSIYKIRKKKGKKFHNLFLNNSYHNSVTSHNLDKVIFNISSHVLSTTEKSLLSKELNLGLKGRNTS